MFFETPGFSGGLRETTCVASFTEELLGLQGCG